MLSQVNLVERSILLQFEDRMVEQLKGFGEVDEDDLFGSLPGVYFLDDASGDLIDLLARTEEAIEDVLVVGVESLHATLEQVVDNLKATLHEEGVLPDLGVPDQQVEPFGELLTDEVEQFDVVRWQQGLEESVEGLDHAVALVCALVDPLQNRQQSTLNKDDLGVHLPVQPQQHQKLVVGLP